MIGKRSFESFEAFENLVWFPWLGFRGFNVFLGCCLQKTSVGMSLIVETSSSKKWMIHAMKATVILCPKLRMVYTPLALKS